MADEHAPTQQVPVVAPPAERVDERAEKQGGIGHTPRDHHVRATIERVDDAVRPEIGVRRLDTIAADVADLACSRQQIGIRVQRQLQHVVAGQGGDLQTLKPKVPGDLHHTPGGGDRIGRAHVADDPHPLAAAAGQHRPHAGLQQRIVSGGGIHPLGPLRQGDGALRQAFEHQVVEAAMLDQLHRRFDPVAREAGARADTDRLHRGSTPKTTAAPVMTSDAQNR